MEVNEFAKYVVDNMCRATVGNALNIVNKFNGPEAIYKFEDFIVEMEKYINKLVADNYDKNICYKVFTLINKTMAKYNSTVKYNKTFILNDFIIDLWRTMNGH